MRTPRQILMLLLIGVMACPVVAENKKVLIYSTNPQYPPYDWAVDANTFAGAGIELLQKVVPPNVILKPAVYPWRRSFLLAESGEIDLLMPIRITEERKVFLQFLPHRAFPNPIVVFARADRKMKFRKFEDLKPYLGGISLGDTFGGGFDEYWQKELRIEPAVSMVENFRKLDLGRIDYFVTGYYTGMVFLKANGLAKRINALDVPVSTTDIYFGFSRKYRDTEVMNYINARLEALDKQGELERLLTKYEDLYAKNPVVFSP
jgi:polar amino acid transport system substrate-binding protein